MARIRIGISGFGVAGEFFHGAFLAADPTFEIVAISTTNPERAARAARLGPVVRDFEGLLAAEPELVVVASPPQVHREQTMAAIEAGCHVVVDKPFAPTLADAEAMVDAASRAGVLLTVFQNRRFDRDFTTLQRLLSEGAVGTPHTFESRFEWWKPRIDASWKSTTSAADGGGLLLDLGPHLIDQALQLFGPVRAVRSATLRTLRAGASAEDDVFIVLDHEHGVQSRLAMSSLAASMGDRFRLSGDGGSIVIRGLDEQEAALRGRHARPNEDGFRTDRRSLALSDGTGTSQLPLDEGSYGDFYAQVATAIRSGGALPVDPTEALEVMRVLEEIRDTATTD